MWERKRLFCFSILPSRCQFGINFPVVSHEGVSGAERQGRLINQEGHAKLPAKYLRKRVAPLIPCTYRHNGVSKIWKERRSEHGISVPRIAMVIEGAASVASMPAGIQVTVLLSPNYSERRVVALYTRSIYIYMYVRCIYRRSRHRGGTLCLISFTPYVRIIHAHCIHRRT